MLQLTIDAYDDGVPADRVEAKVNIIVRRNENGPSSPLGPQIVPDQARPGYVTVNINATDVDGVSIFIDVYDLIYCL